MNNRRRIIGIVLIMLSLIILCSVIFTSLYKYNGRRQEVLDFARQLDATDRTGKENVVPLIDRSASSVSENVSDDTAPEEFEGEAFISEVESGDCIGILTIDKINLTETVKEGSNDAILKNALGHYEGTAAVGQEGNCCILGHRNYVFGQFFNRLNELEEGDIVQIDTLYGTYFYEVTETYVVSPEQMEVLDYIEGNNLTLITCTPLFVGSHRLIVRCKLIK